MRKIDLGQTIQILANLGVIAGIGVLALELRQNNELLGVAYRTAASERVQATTALVLENPHLLEALGKDVATLTPTERDALVLLGIRMLGVIEVAYRDVARGFNDEEVLRRNARALWHRPRLNYGMPLAWDTFKMRADPGFVAWMEENVINREASTGNAERATQ
jgi:hypothetical protein